MANFKMNSRVLFCIAFMVFHVKFNVQSSSIKEGLRVALLLTLSKQSTSNFSGPPTSPLSLLGLPPFYLPATTNTTTTITHTPSSIDCYAPTRSQLFLGATWVRSSMIYFHDTIFLFFKALISFCILYISGIVWLTYLSLVKPMRTNLYLLNNPVSMEYRPVLETCCCCC